MGRKPLPASKRKKPFNLLLDEPLRAALEKAATARGNTLTDEIRNRLVTDLWEELFFDRPTRELAYQIMLMARTIRQQYAPWHKSEKAFQALTAAITAWLTLEREGVKREAEALEDPAMHALDDDGSPAFPDPFGQDDPGTIGRLAARTIWKAQHEFVEDQQFEKERPKEFKKLASIIEAATKARRRKPKKS
jgi:hypothetical protein